MGEPLRRRRRMRLRFGKANVRSAIILVLMTINESVTWQTNKAINSHLLSTSFTVITQSEQGRGAWKQLMFLCSCWLSPHSKPQPVHTTAKIKPTKRLSVSWTPLLGLNTDTLQLLTHTDDPYSSFTPRGTNAHTLSWGTCSHRK